MVSRLTRPSTTDHGGRNSYPRNETQTWYEALEFEPSPADPCHLFLLMKDLRAPLSDSR